MQQNDLVLCVIVKAIIIVCSHNVYKGAVAHGRVPSQKIAQLSLNISLVDIFYTNM